MPSQPDSLRIAFSSTGATRTAAARASTPATLAHELTELGHEVDGLLGPAVPRLDRPDAARSRSRASTSTGPRTRSGCRGRGSSRPRSTCRSSPSCARPGSPSRTRSACGSAGCSRDRRADFDLVHDNQCLGSGLLGMMDDGWPVLATLHHPITVDRDLDLAHATERRGGASRCAAGTGSSACRCRSRAQLPRVVTVSESSKRDIVAQMGVAADRLHVVPVGVDPSMLPPDARRSRACPAGS